MFDVETLLWAQVCKLIFNMLPIFCGEKEAKSENYYSMFYIFWLEIKWQMYLII